MDKDKAQTFIMVPAEEFALLKSTQQEILTCLQEIKDKLRPTTTGDNYILAEEFMQQTKMGRTKFYDMVNHNKIRVIRKLRKTYVLASEVKRYFVDPTMS